MEGFEAVQNFFCSMHCSKCQNLLKPDGITILREENNFYVVKIVCIDCNQPVGLAIVGIASKDADETYKQNTKQMVGSVTAPKPPPIDYDEVIEAHKFFSNLGSDWSKHIQELGHNIELDDIDDSDDFEDPDDY